jgi:CubicO group peptidase (beta-lactamase class C family)
MSRRTLSAILAPVLIALSSSASGDSPERAPTIEASPAVSAEERAEQTIAELEESIPDLMEKARIPGLQIALIRRGEVIWRGAYGVTNTAGGAVVTRDTIFEAASLTKPLFAYVVMQMVDKKLIDLDTPLLEAVPKERAEELIGHSLDTEGFRLDWAKKITARHVLSHSAGMPHGDGGEIYPIFFEPGTDWKYSAQGYQFLQMVVEGIEGKPLVKSRWPMAIGSMADRKKSANGAGRPLRPACTRQPVIMRASFVRFSTAPA